MDEGRLGNCTLKRKRKRTLTKRCHVASRKHADRTSTRTAATYGEVVAAVTGEQDNTVDPVVVGKALFEKKSQMKQVRQGLSQWDRDTRIHHRSHDDQ